MTEPRPLSSGPSAPPAPVEGVAAGVPYTALPPQGGDLGSAPLVVTWHLMDPPSTDAAMAAALPMHGVPAWRVHLGLPMTGRRLIDGGFDELMRLGYEDAVLNLFGPIADQAAAEAGAAVAAARAELGIADGPVGILGGSLGSLVAAEVLATGVLPVRAAALVSPALRLASVIEANESRFDTFYAWSERSREVAAKYDFVARAGEIAARRVDGRPPAVLVVAGQDEAEEFRRTAQAVVDALATRYAEVGADPKLVRLATPAGVGHALADEPGIEPAPQTDAARVVDAEVTDWFYTHLAAR